MLKRKWNMIKKTVFILSILFVSIYAWAGYDLSQKIALGDDVLIALPKDWVQIPQQAIDMLNAKNAQLNVKGAKNAAFSFGFQSKYSSRWFSFPYILIKVADSGRVPESQFENTKILQKQNQKVLEEFKNSTGLVKSGQLGKMDYDKDHHILWSSETINYPSAGVVKCLTAVILTQKGSINVNAYIREEDLSDARPFFQAIVKNITIPGPLKYKPQPTDSISTQEWGRGFIMIISAIAVLGLLSLIFAWAQWNMAKNKESLKDVLKVYEGKAEKLRIDLVVKEASGILLKYPQLLIIGAIVSLPVLFMMGTKIDMRSILELSAVSFLLESYCMGLTIRFLYESKEGQPSMLAVNKFVLKKYLALLALFLLTFVIGGFGSVLFLVPGIVLSIRLALGDYGVLLENDPIFLSIKRSWLMTRGNWWRIVCLILVGCLPLIIVQPLGNLVPKPAYLLINFLIQSILFVWAQALMFQVYMTLRRA